MLRRLMIAFALCALGIVSGCGASPEAGLNGTCPLECSSPVLPPANLIIERLDPNIEHTISCSVTGPLASPFQVRYRAYTMIETADTEGEAEEATEDDPQAAKNMRPAQGIGFQPWIVGAVDPESTNEEWKTKDANGATIADPAQYLGVETSGTELCSDSCGVMTYEFRPFCVSGVTHDITAGILAGFVKATEFIGITIDGGGEDE